MHDIIRITLSKKDYEENTQNSKVKKGYRKLITIISLFFRLFLYSYFTTPTFYFIVVYE